MTATAHVILIVDDDVDFLEINRLILEAAGYAVVCAADPNEAFAKLDEVVPDLIITDLMMSSVDSGFGFARALKDDDRFSHIPIVISTSVSSQLGLDFRPQSPADLAKMHVDAYFDKPIDAAALVAKVRELIGA